MEDTKVFTGDAAANMAKTGDSFQNMVARLGTRNPQNALSYGHYAFNLLTRNRLQLEAAYRGSWVVGAVVENVADDMTRAGIDITTNKGAKNIEDVTSAMSRLQIMQSMNSGIKWGRLYGGAIGVINIEGQDSSTPLRIETVGKDQFKGIIPFDRWQIQPDLVRTIEEGPEYGLPKFYDIIGTAVSATPNATQAQIDLGGLKFHHSRVIRFIGIELPYYQAITENMWGESVIERMFDRLISFDTSTMSAANLINRAYLRTVSVEGLREIIASGGKAFDGLMEMFEMIRMMQVNEGLTIIDAKDKLEMGAYSFTGLSDMMLQFGQQLSGASGIPLVRLFGQSPAGLNSTGDADIRMYYDNINAQQESRLRNPFELILKVLWRSLFGKDMPKDLTFTFTALWQMSALDKATIGKSNTETILGAYESGIITRAIALKELRQQSKETGLFTNITDDDITEADNEEPPMPDGSVIDPNMLPEPVKNLDSKPNFFTRIKAMLK